MFIIIYLCTYKRSLISHPFSFLLAILEPNCKARFGKLAAFTSPN